MAPGETAEFSVSFTPGQTRCDKSITWSSSDPSVISVDKNGKVTAKKIGTATITAVAVDGSKAQRFIRVTKKNIGSVKDFRVLIDGKDVTEGSITLKNRKEYDLTIKTDPSQAV